MIKDKPLPARLFKIGVMIFSWYMRRKFNKLIINQIEIKPNHSYLLMSNHFSFWDGPLAFYLIRQAIDKRQPLTSIKIMVMKKQMEMNKWLKYVGCFSISPGIAAMEKSLNYAAESLNESGNLLLMYPQGNLESSHVREIKFKEGIANIIPKIKGDCQLIWCSTLTEYFESIKPTVYFDMIDCGTNHDFNFDSLKEKVNRHHKNAIKKQFRFTDES